MRRAATSEMQTSVWSKAALTNNHDAGLPQDATHPQQQFLEFNLNPPLEKHSSKDRLFNTDTFKVYTHRISITFTFLFQRYLFEA